MCVIGGLSGDSDSLFDLKVRLAGNLPAPPMPVWHNNTLTRDELTLVPVVQVDDMCVTDVLDVSAAVSALNVGDPVPLVCVDPAPHAPCPCPPGDSAVDVALGVSVVGAFANQTLSPGLSAPTGEDPFFLPGALVDCGANSVGDGDTCTPGVVTDGDYFVPFEIGPDRPPGFALFAGAREAQVGRDAGVANPVGASPALHSAPGALANLTVTVDVGPAPSGGATLPVRRESPDVTDLAAGSAGTLPRACASEFAGGDLCLTDVVAIPASPGAPQQVLVPVEVELPADGRATLTFGRHEVIVEHTP